MKSAYNLKRESLAVVLVSFILIGGVLPQAALALSIDDACTGISNRLIAEQIQQGNDAGTWTNEADFTGSIAAGMMAAYELTSESTCMVSAELGGDYILHSAQGNFFGDEAYALTCLSQAASDPCDNVWRTAAESFYASVRANYPGATQGYVNDFVGIEPSTAVFYVANHVVAAFYVDAADKEIWRQGLIEWLCSVDDSCPYPVMALGVATWALAQTGPLDETPVDPDGRGAAHWDGRSLKDLPDLLLSHQVPNGHPDAGSFYWQFEHADDSPCGYTEDAVFAILGLTAVAQTHADPNLDVAILAARKALLGGVSPDGLVWEHLSQEGEVHYVYAGEMLQGLEALALLPPVRGDLNQDGQVDLADLEIVIGQFGSADCEEPLWCDGADMNNDGKVDGEDIQIMLEVLVKYQGPISGVESAS